MATSALFSKTISARLLSHANPTHSPTQPIFGILRPAPHVAATLHPAQLIRVLVQPNTLSPMQIGLMRRAQHDLPRHVKAGARQDTPLNYELTDYLHLSTIGLLFQPNRAFPYCFAYFTQTTEWAYFEYPLRFFWGGGRMRDAILKAVVLPLLFLTRYFYPDAQIV